ncbi:CRISPR-associated protein, Cse1 family [Syntrophus gentianae]|uniref:CRISPR-associated protein, Cse1 family n=1 Tax=Syntrophus gentianae TaxID=43775 RepID=A0A1H8A852_9BACT|nr:type I-E CRISPR-associated protein Cse1/CasA [Syntrophus gentianae]SEM66733.1 CRISPR-associated protein, Cse1 family [Syntrophus gentianae]
MNLLTEQWIPVRPLEGGKSGKISLRDLLCGEEKWELYLPRDDMELAAIQLLICITQVLITPKCPAELKRFIAKPLSVADYEVAIQPYIDWFQLDHPKYPFMQVRGVVAKDPTPMDKLLAGLTGATNCCFVNENGLAEKLCGGCASIALFNLGSCSPSFGGGFKPGLRGPSAPITTLIQGRHLRETIWLNVLNEEEVEKTIPWYQQTKQQKTTSLEPIKAGENISIQKIGLIRGLLWQPACVELLPVSGEGVCDCCGFLSNHVYLFFAKAKFNYTVEGTWPHPHSPMTTIKKRDGMKEKIASFGTSTAPSWTQLARIVVQQQIDHDSIEGHQPAAVIQQVRMLYGQQAQKLHLIVGGYLNRAGQASITGRRHEVFTLNHGWDRNTNVIKELVSVGIGYKGAVTSALFFFCKGFKDKKVKTNTLKGLGDKIDLPKVAEARFYRRSEPTIENTLANIDFDNPELELAKMRKALKRISEDIFEESIRPYLNDPELIRTLAASRRTLFKHLNNLEPQQGKGRNNGKEGTS